MSAPSSSHALACRRIWYRLDQIMLAGFFRNAKFLLEEISKPLRYNSRNFSAREPDLIIGSRCGTVCALRCAPQDPRFQIAARNQSPGRLEPAAQSTPRVARKRWKSRPKEDLEPAYIRRLSRTAASWCRRTWR